MSTNDTEQATKHETSRASAPVSKFDFVNGVAGSSLSSADLHPTNRALAKQAVLGLNGSVMVTSRELTTETLGKPAVFSSADLVEQGNTQPLIPLGIDPPDHGRYRRFLDPLFSPRRMEAQEADIAERANHFIDTFIGRGSCDFTAEFAELFPSAVFLGLMGLPWEELETLVRLRDGLLHPGTPESTAQERSTIQRETAQQVYAYFDRILDDREAHPRGDVLSAIVGHGEDDVALPGDSMSRDEALGTCFVLLTAGLDTVTDSLTCFWAR